MYFSYFIGGAIRLVEEEIKRPVLWDICLLHCNELPFKKFFKYCDAQGKDVNTTSPSYDGHIGKTFKDGLELMPIVNFKTVPGKLEILPNDFINSLNNDSKYLYKICHAIMGGYRRFPQNLIYKIIGKAHQGR